VSFFFPLKFTACYVDLLLLFASPSASRCLQSSGCADLELRSASDHSYHVRIQSSPVFSGILQIATSLQYFVLGPRLVLSVRDYYAELLANSDAGAGMSTIQFQDRTYLSTGGDV